jgi:membrane protein implicated in regulation of membrane protease activity
MTLADILKFLASAAVFSAIAIAWIRIFGRPLFHLNRAIAIRIVGRIGCIHAVVAFVCCVIGQMSADELAMPLGIYLSATLVSLLLVRLGGGGGDVGAAVVAGFIFAVLCPAFALAYFAVAPARIRSIFEPESQPPIAPQCSIDSEQINQDAIGLVVSPLKPFGSIELDGQKIAACSVDGGFVPAGERVQVDRREGRTMFVKRVNVQA